MNSVSPSFKILVNISMIQVIILLLSYPTERYIHLVTKYFSAWISQNISWRKVKAFISIATQFAWVTQYIYQCCWCVVFHSKHSLCPWSLQPVSLNDWNNLWLYFFKFISQWPSLLLPICSDNTVNILTSRTMLYTGQTCLKQAMKGQSKNDLWMQVAT